MPDESSAAPGGSADDAPPPSAFPPGQWPPPPPPPPPPGWAPPPPPPGWAQQPPPYAAPPPYGTPPPYAAPPPGIYVTAPSKPTNGLAIASMVLGIVWIYWLGSLLAVIFGHIALHQIKRDPHQGGRGMAIAGVALGWTGVGLGLVFLVVVSIAASNG